MRNQKEINRLKLPDNWKVVKKGSPSCWHWLRLGHYWEGNVTNEEAKLIFQSYEVLEASLDHDMGLHLEDPDELDADLRRGLDEEDGYQLACWMVDNRFVPERVTIHSWNPVGAKRMAQKLAEEGCEALVEPYSSRSDVY